MGYELIAGVIGVLLACLFVIYARSKTRASPKPRQNDPSVHEEPDAITKVAGGILKAHKIYSRIFGAIVIVVVLAGAIFDSLTRMIVLSTVGLMVIIALVAKVFGRRKAKSGE